MYRIARRYSGAAGCARDRGRKVTPATRSMVARCASVPDHVVVRPTSTQLRRHVGATAEVRVPAGQAVDDDGIGALPEIETHIDQERTCSLALGQMDGCAPCNEIGAFPVAITWEALGGVV